MSKYLWKFGWDCGRSGSLGGLFVATEDEVKDLIGRYAYFGEVLGKYSEVSGHIEEGDIQKIDISPEAVEEVSGVLGDTWSGFNPTEYVHYPCVRCEDTAIPDDLYEVNGEYVCWSCATKEERERG